MKQFKKWLLSTAIIQLFFTGTLFSVDCENSNIDLVYESADGFNVLYWGCNYRTPDPTLYINVTSVTGGSGNYTVTPGDGTFVSHNNISEGQGFSFYFTEIAQNNNTVKFTISDAGNSCDIDFPVETQLYFLNIGDCAQPSFVCQDDVVHQQGMVGITDYDVNNTITSSGTIQADSEVNYYAEQLIDLKMGFEVKLNADFSAVIRDCQ